MSKVDGAKLLIAPSAFLYLSIFMSKSEITSCLIKIDLEQDPLYYSLNSDEQKIFNYCIRQGAKNNIGIFIEHRGFIAMKLKIDHDIAYHFFLDKKNHVYFDEETHIIYVRNFYKYIDFGYNGNLYRQKKDKDNGTYSITLDRFNFLKKANFVSKVNSAFNSPNLKDHEVKKIFVEDNFQLLSDLNNELKTIKGNKHNFEKLLTSYQQSY